MDFVSKKLSWIRKPKNFIIDNDKIEIITEPHTDLWQRTYYHFRNDNAPVLQMETSEKYFSFVVKTNFNSKKCSNCGNLKEMTVDKRTYKCEHCGLIINRDLNAAINLANYIDIK